jgi:uncharacterized protein
MISLQKLFGKNDLFYSLLEQSSQQAHRSVLALKNLVAGTDSSANLEAFKESRRTDKKITEQINTELCRVFVTELEREDIEALSNALYKIPKTVEKIAERIMICESRLTGTDFGRQLVMMETAANIVVKMVAQLRLKMHLETMKTMNAELQRVEGEADKLILDLLRELYQGDDAIKVIMLRDVYDLMEKVVDRCRDAGNVLSHIVLKYT